VEAFKGQWVVLPSTYTPFLVPPWLQFSGIMASSLTFSLQDDIADFVMQRIVGSRPMWRDIM
jgi:hypothetical protein